MAHKTPSKGRALRRKMSDGQRETAGCKGAEGHLWGGQWRHAYILAVAANCVFTATELTTRTEYLRRTTVHVQSRPVRKGTLPDVLAAVDWRCRETDVRRLVIQSTGWRWSPPSLFQLSPRSQCRVLPRHPPGSCNHSLLILSKGTFPGISTKCAFP